VRVTVAVIVTTSPNLIGFCHDTLSTEAVTTTALACLPPAMAQAISIQCKILPPLRLLSALVSLGRTISVIIVTESLGHFPWAMCCVVLIKIIRVSFFRSGTRTVKCFCAVCLK